MTRRWLALVALAVAGYLGMSYTVAWLTARPPVQALSQPGPLILVGVPSLAWEHDTATADPVLWSLARRGAVGAMATRSLSAHSCSLQSWLTLSASARTTIGRTVPATHGERTTECPQPVTPQVSAGDMFFPDWATWRTSALARPLSADIGRLGSSMTKIGQCISAHGELAGLGAANRVGLIAHYSPSTTNPDLHTCPVTFISLPAYSDTYIAHLMKRLPPKSTLVVAGMADDTAPESLHAVVIAGPGVPHGQLTSEATRQPGVLQLTDLSALVLARMGAAAPHLTEGSVPVVQSTSSPTASVVAASELTEVLTVEHAFVAPFFISYLGVVVVALLLCSLWWWRQRRRGRPAGILVRAAYAIVGGMAAAMPVSTFLVGLVPWWRAGDPRLALAGFIVAFAAVLTAAALLGPWRRWKRGPMLFLAGATLVTITLDIIYGSRLQFTSMIGLQPVYGGRFYGNGNMGYAIMATTGILIAATLAGKLIEGRHRRLATLTVLLVGSFVVLVDGFPSWGADGGGPTALIPTFGYLALNAAGVRLTWLRIAVIGSCTALIVSGLAVLDYLRAPKYRTHLGDFVSQVRNHGNFSGVDRIWQANWHMLTSSFGTMLVPFMLLYAILALVRPDWPIARPIRPLLEKVTFLGHGLAATVVCWLIGFLSNDSGTAIPPGGMMIAAPLLIVLSACLSWSRPPKPKPARSAPVEWKPRRTLSRQHPHDPTMDI
ncbi:hypothetical protein [Leekyejoonella antrihumi]|uniref:Uncharacterized protein n=1 Tax=Leekyejoonella antrihumi TaxID=1660198 RepID=A0A563E0L6_9MICO|nr:hypothetical protein [Leekyejoonella antrihumi]TWP35919.1 hypothetical protein FGL98_11840 [Leekyejoonella antrihumi]